MEDWSTNDASTLYGGTIGGSTIFDIVWPGAHLSGMSFTDSSTVQLTPTDDDYKLILNGLNTDQAKKDWSARQKGSILQQLRNGVRFLDLQFVYDATADEYYSYNGLLGRSVTEIISDIKTFLTTHGTKELILIYLHDYEDNEGLLERFATDTDIQSKLAQSSVDDIHSTTINDLITDGIQIIIFADYISMTYTNANYFYHEESYLFIPTNGTSTTKASNTTNQITEVRSSVINNIRYGWPDDRLNLIHWTPDIGATFEEQYLYSSWQHFSAGVNNELSTVINAYPKLWFANVIMADFIEISDIMEQILLLNYGYFNCKDQKWGNNGTECPGLTDLKSKYFTDTISPLCTINTYLQDLTECPRSCGVCNSVIANQGNPGDACTSNTDCDGILYSANYGYSNSEGVCFQRPDEQRAKDNIQQESFCLALNAQPSCTNYDVQDKCAANGTQAIDVSDCQQYCTANWQCEDGFCNTQYSVCMTLLETSTTSAPDSNSRSNERYYFIESTGAENMLKDVALFRPGNYQDPPNFSQVECNPSNPGGAINECLLAGMNANPYLASLVGFAIIPFIMAIWLCTCYTCCCCPCWCICDQCAKKCCCCHKVMKDPIADEATCKQWTPLAFLVGCMIVIIWACVEGIINNNEMHDHIFAEDNSVRAAINNLADDIIGRFESVEPTAEYIIDFSVGIINDVFGILETNTDAISGTIDDLYVALDIIAGNYSNGVNISGTFRNPFNDSKQEDFTIECPYCDQISDIASDIKTSLNSSIGPQLGNIDNLINQTKGLLNARGTIRNATASYLNTLKGVINTSYEYQELANGYIDLGAEYDIKYRQQPAMIFFCIPMGLVIFVILGVILKNKWCFKCEWCLSMYVCGIPIMLLSWPFIFFAVLWGDLCVRLDDFEQNLGQSQIGKLAQLDNLTVDDPAALGLKVMNTCFYGGSVLDLFNLSDQLNWDPFRETLNEQLDVDIAGLLDIGEIASFKTEIDTLSVDEFGSVVDSYIANANSVGDYCGCGARQSERPFSRENLWRDNGNDVDFCATYTPPNATDPELPFTYPPTPAVTPSANWTQVPYTTPAFPEGYNALSPYWKNMSLYASDKFGDCLNAYVNASAAVQIFYGLSADADRKITGIKTDADRVFDVYDDIYGIALGLEEDISTISCLVEPLFDQFDVIIENYTNCGFIGAAYGDFKEAGCVNLFDDWYKIARALAVIAYISILIVFLGLCMDYIYGPVKERQPSVMPDEVELAQKMSTDENAGSMLETSDGMTSPGTMPGTSPGTAPGATLAPPGTFDDAPPSDAPRDGAASVASLSYASHVNSTGYNEQTFNPPPPSGAPPAAASESYVQAYEIRYDHENPSSNLQPLAQGDEFVGDGARVGTFDTAMSSVLPPEENSEEFHY